MEKTVSFFGHSTGRAVTDWVRRTEVLLCLFCLAVVFVFFAAMFHAGEYASNDRSPDRLATQAVIDGSSRNMDSLQTVEVPPATAGTVFPFLRLRSSDTLSGRFSMTVPYRNTILFAILISIFFAGIVFRKFRYWPNSGTIYLKTIRKTVHPVRAGPLF